MSEFLPNQVPKENWPKYFHSFGKFGVKCGICGKGYDGNISSCSGRWNICVANCRDCDSKLTSFVDQKIQEFPCELVNIGDALGTIVHPC